MNDKADFTQGSILKKLVFFLNNLLFAASSKNIKVCKVILSKLSIFKKSNIF